eukprot:COSAG04_NODE_1859_length_5375_cov_2.368082_3_plen_251_part_00
MADEGARHGAHLSHADQQRFAYELSEASPHVGPPTLGHPVFGHVDGFPEIYSVHQSSDTRPLDVEEAQTRAEKRPWTGWHTDVSGCVNPPAIGILRAARVPASCPGDTLFADMAAALERLDPETQEAIRGMAAVHRSTTELEPWIGRSKTYAPFTDRQMISRHPLVVVHPDTGERLLYCSPGLLDHFADMPRIHDYDDPRVGQFPRESELLRETLFGEAVRDAVSYTWSEGVSRAMIAGIWVAFFQECQQ